MSGLTRLVHGSKQRRVSVAALLTHCTLFANNLSLLAAPYVIKSAVPISDFQDFISEIEGNPVEIASVNFVGLSLLCDELGFTRLATRLSQYRSSGDFVGLLDNTILGRLAVLEERGLTRDREFAVLEAAHLEQSAALERALTAVKSLRSSSVSEQRRLTAEIHRVSPAIYSFRRFSESEQNSLCDDHNRLTAEIAQVSAAVDSLRSFSESEQGCLTANIG
jgi:hypothetical protein